MGVIMQYLVVAAHICLGVAAASYIWNAFRRSPRAGTWATMMTWMGAVFLLLSLAIRWYLAGHAPHVVVPPGCWQSARSEGAWTLVSCVVAPAFEFAGFELAAPGWHPGSGAART